MADIFGDALDNEIPGTVDVDLIKGLGGNDSLDGLAENDTLAGGGGDDTLNGGTEDDTLKGGGGSDTLNGEEGDDTLIGAKGSDTLDGGEGNDRYQIVAKDAGFADAFSDSGSAGTDTIDATRVTDLLLSDAFNGGTGIEVIEGDDVEGLNLIAGLAEVVWDFTLMSLLNVNAISGSLVDDVITGSAGADKIKGLSGDDELIGGNGADNLKGGGGDDTLDGGAGDDKLNGGGGDDTLIYDAADTILVNGKTGTDTLLVQGNGVDVELTSGTAGVVYQGLEVVDIGGSGANTLTLDLASLLALSLESDTLRVMGDADDAVITASGTWTSAGTTVVNTITYNEYTNGTGVLQVQQGINVAGIDTPGNDAPHAGADVATTGEESSVLTGNVLANDTDADGDTLSVSGFDATSAGGGTVTNNGNGTFTYDPDGAYNGLAEGETDTDTFAYTVSDGQGGTDTGTVTVTITGSNDAPVNTVPGGQTTNEDSAKVFSSGNGNALSVSDPDGDSLTVTLFVSDGALTLSGVAGLNFTTGDGTGDATLTFSGTATAINTALNGLSYLPTSNFNSSDSLSVTTSDGTASDVDNVAITINAVNDAPVVAAAGTAIYNLGDAGVAVDDSLSVTDVDSADLVGATVTIANVQAGDLLDFSDQNGIAGDYNTNSGVLTLSGSASVAEYQTALQSITFSTENLAQVDRSVSIVVDDGDDTSATDTATIDISAVINLSSLNADNGFQFSGEAMGDALGRVGGAGDVNGDGFADYILGAIGADPHGSVSGASYFVPGEGGQAFSDVNVSALNGTFGFQLSGEAANDQSGYSVQGAGDVNGDGFDDIIIGARKADTSTTDSGAAYVIFGKASGFTAILELSALNGTNGFKISGEAASDFAGFTVSGAGDVNGDGFADLLVGAYGADANSLANSGATYVIYGKSDFSGTAGNLNLSALIGSNGFKISGVAAGDRAGYSVSTAGDVNGDGLSDIAIGAPSALSGSGTAYVVFGQSTGFASNFDLSTLNGANGFKMLGYDSSERVGCSVSDAGDIDGDGFGDLLVGAFGNPENGTSAGAAYLVFGGNSFSTSMQLSALNGSNGFQITGEAAEDRLGTSVSGAGDVNGDGFDDILVGAWRDSTNGVYAGAAYIVFGSAASFSSEFSASSLDGLNGLKFVGEAEGDNAGTFVSDAGDVNGDGFDDFMIGADSATSLGGSGAGAAYVIFGGDFRNEVDPQTFFGGDNFDNLLVGSGITDTIDALAGNDIVNGAFGNDSIEGGAGHDLLEGGAGADALSGGADNDRLFGDDGADTLDGGLGADVLVGGADNDTFLFNDTLGSGNVDVIMDFAGAGATVLDIIKLDDAVFTALGTGALTGAAFESGPGLTAAATSAGRIIYNTTSGALYYDEDGNDVIAAVQFAVIASDVDGLTAADFVVI